MKAYIIIISLLIMMPLVVAQPPIQTTSVLENTLQIRFPQQEYLIIDKNYSLHFHVYNATDGIVVTNETASCYFHLYNMSGEHIITEQVILFDDDYDFMFDIEGGNFSGIGDYPYVIQCNTSAQGGFVSGFFLVNGTGFELTTANIWLLFIGISFFFILGTILMMGFFNWENNQPVRWTVLVFAIIFFVISLNIISIILSDEMINPKIATFFENITAISFIFYWFAAGILIIIWLFTFINTWIFKKNLSNARRFGIA